MNWSPDKNTILMTTDTVGGVWTYTMELTRGLTARGFQVILAAMGATPSAAQQDEMNAIDGLLCHARPYKLAWMESPWEDIRAARAWLRELASAFKPDLVHLNTLAHGEVLTAIPQLTVVHSCVMSWFEAVRGRAPVGTMHLNYVPDPAPLLPDQDLERWQKYRQLVLKTLQTSDRIITPSAAMMQQVRSHYDLSAEINVIYNGRDAQKYVSSASIKEQVVLTAGRLWDEAKNAECLARSAHAIKWPVYIAGNPEHPDGGRARLAQQERFENIECLGQLDQTTLNSWFARSSIYALPARYEPFGLTPLEAALADNALVLGDIPSLREIWGDAALFIHPDRPKDLAHAINALIDDPDLRATFSRRARQRAKGLSTKRMVDRYIRIYDELLTSHAPQSLKSDHLTDDRINDQISQKYSEPNDRKISAYSRGGRH